MGLQRDFFEDGVYHLITRGNNKQNIFLYKKDYLRYLHYLNKYSQKFSIKIFAYCLMPNHTHLLVRQSNTAISTFMQAINTAFAKYFNVRHSQVGHLFQGPFRHVPVDTDEYLLHLSRYIHLNPSSAGLVRKPEDYAWSSYRHYFGLEKIPFVDEKPILSYYSKDKTNQYKKFVESRIDYQRELSIAKLFLE